MANEASKPYQYESILSLLPKIIRNSSNQAWQAGQYLCTTLYISNNSLCSKTPKTREKTAKAYNARFCYLLGILKLAWYLKSRYLGTYRWVGVSSTK